MTFPSLANAIPLLISGIPIELTKYNFLDQGRLENLQGKEGKKSKVNVTNV